MNIQPGPDSDVDDAEAGAEAAMPAKWQLAILLIVCSDSNYKLIRNLKAHGFMMSFQSS